MARIIPDPAATTAATDDSSATNCTRCGTLTGKIIHAASKLGELHLDASAQVRGHCLELLVQCGKLRDNGGGHYTGTAARRSAEEIGSRCSTSVAAG